MRCIMKEMMEPSHSESIKLMKIIQLRNRIEELHQQSGPNSTKYIDLSLQLNALEKEYIEEKIRSFKELKTTSFLITKIPRTPSRRTRKRIRRMSNSTPCCLRAMRKPSAIIANEPSIVCFRECCPPASPTWLCSRTRLSFRRTRGAETSSPNPRTRRCSERW